MRLKSVERRFDIDALRVCAVLLGLLYHTGRAFDFEPWHIKNAQMSEWFDLLGIVLTPWRMPLLMLLAGAGTYFALGVRSGGQYAGERFRRLFIPLAVGMLVVVPPQIYIERISSWVPNRMVATNFTGSFFDFYATVFTTGPYPNGNLSWHHMWFVAYLFVFSLVALPLFLALRGGIGSQVIDWLATRLATRAGLAALALPLIAIELMLRTRSGNNQTLVGDWANLAHYGTLFVYGYLLMADERFARVLARERRLALGLVAVLVPARVVWLGLDHGLSTPLPAMLALRTAVEWVGLLALLGYGHAYLNRPRRVLSWAGEIAYPFYIWHQTVIVIVAYFVVQWDASIGLKFPAILVTSLIATVAACETVRRVGLLRPLFGLKVIGTPRVAPRASIEANQPLAA